MKKLIVFSILILNVSFVFGQTEDDLKRVLHAPINEIFHRWDDEWSVDDYIDESAIITYFKDSEYSNTQIFAHGSFKVKRWFSTVKIQFTAKINITSSGMGIKSICYKDSTTDDEGCCNPSDYNLGKIYP